MITRAITKALGELFENTFSVRASGQYSSSYVSRSELYDFLFEHDYPAWLCNIAKNLPGTGTRPAKDFILQLHTGETQAPVTEGWTWKQREQLGQELLQSLTEDILKYWSGNQYRQRGIDPQLDTLQRQLELSGYVFEKGRLLAPESDVLDAAEAEGVLETLWRELRLPEQEATFRHLRLSEEHYLAKRWEDSISNSRKFLEATLQNVAAGFHNASHQPLDPQSLTRPAAVRDYLERVGLLEAKEKVAVGATYGLLSETGGHPYMAEHDQARLLRHLALTFSQFVLLRLKARRDRP